MKSDNFPQKGILKYLYFIFGSISFIIGFIGIFIPGLPTTIFMIIAAYFYYRSSAKFYNYIINHPIFGNTVNNFLSGKGMTIKAKIISISSIWLFSLLSIAVFSKFILILVILLALLGTFFILKQKTYSILK